MRWMLFALLAGIVSGGQDLRNTVCPNTDTPAKLEAPDTLEAWQKRRAELRAQILTAAGLAPMPKRNALAPIVVKRLEYDDYTVESVALETRPGYWLGGNLYRPKERGVRHPAVLFPHGHWNYGRLEHQPLYSGPSLGITLAKHGFVVFAYDMVGYNDTAQTPHDFTSKALQMWSFTPLGLQLWNSMRVVDYLESLPDVDGKKIAATGASGGGTQTFLLAAVDDRIAASAPVNMVSGIMQGGCVCENAPGLRIGTNNIETAAIFAPKPMLVVAATGDWTRNVPKAEYPALQKVYGLYGQTAKVEMVQIDAPHNYQKESREAVYEFLRKTFTPEAAPFKEKGVKIERLQDMLVFWNQPRPAQARTFEQVFAEWKAESRAQTAGESVEALRAGLKRVFGEGQRLEEGPVVHRYFDGKGKAILFIHADGMEAALKSGEFEKARATGRPVLVVEAFQTGASKADRDRKHAHFLTFNWSDDAARVQDVAAGVKYLKEKTGGAVEVQAVGEARTWALFAAAVGGGEFAGTLKELPQSDEELAMRFFVPGLQRAGGVEAALRILKGTAR